MKFTLSWLKRHLDTDASLEAICEKLTAIGLEVEGVEDSGALYAPFRVAYVESAEKHPNADKLKVCRVNTGKETLQVVCGAPNARTGMKGIFAPEGSYIPGTDITLKKGVIRGVESCGMLVSAYEMKLSEDRDGIIEIDEKYEIGTPMAEVFGLNEAVIEINLTPNRVDCAGVYGIARDLAAAGIGKLKPQVTKPVKGSFKSSIGVTIEDKDGCPLFLGRLIKNVKNGPSPDWLQNMLKSVGARPISVLVDITNFMTRDQCRPLHVYDADKVKGDIMVRAAKGGEKLDALNDKSYEAVKDTLGICDASGIIGFGGIIGGVSTGCTDDTVNVFLESAYFNPERIAKAGRALQIDSDARYRFERGIDPEFTFEGMEMATQLILELCRTDQTQVSDVVQAGAVPDWKRTINYDPSYVKQLIGMDVPAKRQMDILNALGFEAGSKITPPSWRADVMGKADIAEEIARIEGFDKITPVSVRAESPVPEAAETSLFSRARKARIAMAARGMEECVTWSFMPRDLARAFGSNDNPALTLKNPISSDLDQMRPSILPNLIAAAGRNTDRGYGDVALCEAGPVFYSPKPEDQPVVATGIRTGNYAPRHWATGSGRVVDAFDAKGDALAVLEACGAPAGNAQITREAPSHYHPGRSGALKLGKNVIAYFGEIHPAILEDMKITFPVVGFEVFLQNLPEARKKSGTEKSLLKLEALQPLTRDFAFIVDEGTSAEDVLRAAKSAEKSLIQEAFVFDVYKGKGVDPGKKSVALSVVIQPHEKSLTDSEIESLGARIVDAVTAKAGASLRS